MPRQRSRGTRCGTREYKGVTSILDDSREGLFAGDDAQGLTDINTADPAVIDAGRRRPRRADRPMNIKVKIEGYHTIPEGSTTVAHTWSGDMIGAAVLPAGGHRRRGAGYWQPADRRSSPTTRMCVHEQGQEPGAGAPVHRLHPRQDNAETNFGFVGYLPAIDGPRRPRADRAGLVPENLRNCVLSNEQIEQGLRYLPLTPRSRRSGTTPGRSSAPGADGRGQRSGRRAGRASQRVLGVAQPAGRGVACWRFFVVPFYAMLAVAFGTVDPMLRTPDPEWSPLPWDFSAIDKVLDRVFGGDLGGVVVRTLRSSAGAGAVLPDRLSGRVLRRPAGQPLARRAAGRTGAAVLDQLPDAHAGVGQPACRPTATSTACSSWLHLGGRATGSTAIGRRSSSAWSTDTCRSSSCRCTPRWSASTSG